MSDTVNKNHPNARLCHIMKWDHFDGYGFNLHAEKGKSGQYIGKVDDGSPAEAAGLRQGDRILEVNGESIANKNHKQVVEAIKGLPNETKLLVVDPNDEKQDDNQKTVDHSRPCDTVLIKTVTVGRPVDKILEKSDYTPPPDKVFDKVVEYTSRNGQDQTETQTPVMLNMTAAELRAILKERKKFDPKKDGMDFKKKYDIVQKL